MNEPTKAEWRAEIASDVVDRWEEAEGESMRDGHRASLERLIIEGIGAAVQDESRRSDPPKPEPGGEPWSGRWSDERLTTAPFKDVLDLLLQLNGRVARGGTQHDEAQRFIAEILRRDQRGREDGAREFQGRAERAVKGWRELGPVAPEVRAEMRGHNRAVALCLASIETLPLTEAPEPLGRRPGPHSESCPYPLGHCCCGKLDLAESAPEPPVAEHEAIAPSKHAPDCPEPKGKHRICPWPPEPGAEKESGPPRCKSHDRIGCGTCFFVEYRARRPAPSPPTAEEKERACTCHPSEAPVPCQRKYAFSECKAAEERAALLECREAGEMVLRIAAPDHSLHGVRGYWISERDLEPLRSALTHADKVGK